MAWILLYNLWNETVSAYKGTSMQGYVPIDGSTGEGGGQVLRAALALSMALGSPFRMTNIRAKRPKPGLKRQHLTCIRAAQEICDATVEGDEINSTEITFTPGTVKPGSYRLAIGTGGSVTLVCQALIPPLLFAAEPSHLEISGGTHVPYAPPFEFMRDTLFPMVERLGVKLHARMDRLGYMNIGGGIIHVDITPCSDPHAFVQPEPAPITKTTAVIYGHNLPEGIVERERELLQKESAPLHLSENDILCIDRNIGPDNTPLPVDGTGNMVILTVHQGDQKTVFGECGWRGRSAETVASHTCKRAKEFLCSHASVEACLSDQLPVPLALAGGGSFVTQRLTKHTGTCLKIIELFTGRHAQTVHEQGRNIRITVPSAKE